MYVPKKFKPPSLDAVYKYVDENGFATLINAGSQHLMASHTPLMRINDQNSELLMGHLSAANEQARELKDGMEVLAIFMENHAYISSSWYDHINVPTWNYIAVHIGGTIRILPESEKLACINQLVEKYERGNPQPFTIAQMEERDLNTQLKGIIAFEITVSKIEASWKLSQNRDDKNYHTIIHKLRERGDAMSIHIADEMESIRP
jgi:transcriptional regulator